MGRIKALIAEDDKAIRDLYRKGLAHDLFESRFAADGKETLDLYQKWRPDIIVLDIVMPIMTGYSVLREIRERLCDRSMKIVMSTSLSAKEDVMDCARFGIQGYIVKPFKHTEVGDILLRYLRPDDWRAVPLVTSMRDVVPSVTVTLPVSKS